VNRDVNADPKRGIVIDGLQYCRYDEDTLRELRAGGVSAIHVTIAYHEDFGEAVANIVDWKRRFRDHADHLIPGRDAADVLRAFESGRTAVFFGFQNCSPIEDDIGLVEVCHELGVRFMQLSYNNQSLLAAGCYEAEDSGITRMGREVIAEMNRVGMVVDMSHSAEHSTLQAIELSDRPIAVTHANPAEWHEAPRNKSHAVLAALSETGGMLGFSLYPHHLAGGTDCTLEAFCTMVARTAERHGVDCLGIGSDLCQNQPDSVVEWMRRGRWTHKVGKPASFPAQPAWFRSNADFPGIAAGLDAIGFDGAEVDALLGGNWLRFFERSFPESHARSTSHHSTVRRPG